jgi:hypothetical protein
MLIAGGAVLFISSLLNWRDSRLTSSSGLATDYTGLQGLWVLLIGAGIAVLVALQTFANVNLPARVIGFTWNQLYMVFGLAAFLITFGLQFADRVAFGVTLGWIAAAVVVAGAFLELQQGARENADSRPTSF